MTMFRIIATHPDFKDDTLDYDVEARSIELAKKEALKMMPNGITIVKCYKIGEND